MKIYVDSTFLANKSGIGREARSNFNALFKLDESEIIAIDPMMLIPGPKLFNRIITKHLILFKVLILGRPQKFQLPDDCDVFFQPHIHSFVPKSGNYKYLIRLHDIFPITNPEWFHRHSSRLFKIAFNYSLGKAIFIADSNFTSDALTSLANVGTKSVVALCVVHDIPREFCENCDFCVKTEIPDFFHISIGTIEPRKNYDFVLETFSEREQKKLSNLIICGKVGWKSRKTIREIKRLVKLGNVVWFQNICDGGIRELLSLSQGLISCSKAEGFNLPVAESLFLGIPVVLSDIAIHRELYPNSIFFEINDSKSLVAALTTEKTLEVKRPEWLDPLKLELEFARIFQANARK